MSEEGEGAFGLSSTKLDLFGFSANVVYFDLRSFY